MSPRRTTCTISGCVLAVTRWGEGSPVLCLHALGHAAEDFEDFAARVGDRCEVVEIDWPGHGASAPDGGAVRAERFADLALGVCHALAMARPIVLGNSIGGAAALIAARREPSTFAGLVLCNAAGLAPLDIATRLAVFAMTRFFAAGERGARWFLPVFARYYRSAVLTAPAAAARRAVIVAGAPRLASLLRDSGAAHPFESNAGGSRAAARGGPCAGRSSGRPGGKQRRRPLGLAARLDDYAAALEGDLDDDDLLPF